MDYCGCICLKLPDMVQLHMETSQVHKKVVNGACLSGELTGLPSEWREYCYPFHELNSNGNVEWNTTEEMTVSDGYKARGLGRCMAVGGEALQAQSRALMAVKVCFIN